MALCHSGESLYQDGDPLYLDRDSTQCLDKEVYWERVRGCEGTRWPAVEVRCDKDRYIYDREMPQMAHEVEGVKRGDWLKGMVVDSSA